jgi:hypothetical protein
MTDMAMDISCMDAWVLLEQKENKKRAQSRNRMTENRSSQGSSRRSAGDA